tara:strand:- start:280 stop:1158 length:879 start_codon:yes stop_codon:yes gene_type:complete
MTSYLFNKVALIGVGLINSSLARALKEKKIVKEIIATSRTLKTRKEVENLGIVDKVTSSAIEAVKDADIIIVGIPVAAYLGVIEELKNVFKEGAIVTDVGSVKGSVVKEISSLLPAHVHFVPGHPIAGTEYSGPSAGFSELFKGHWCVLTPDDNTDQNSINKVRDMWIAVGMKVDIMSPDHHDSVLAITSHIPHLIAFSIVGTVTNMEEDLKIEVIKYAAGGFRDFTRIAASDPIMWRDIFLSNKGAVLEMLSQFGKDLDNVKFAIQEEDSKTLEKLFTKTRMIRRDIVGKE